MKKTKSYAEKVARAVKQIENSQNATSTSSPQPQETNKIVNSSGKDITNNDVENIEATDNNDFNMRLSVSHRLGRPSSTFQLISEDGTGI